MCFVFGALKIRDRIQTIPFDLISTASRGPQYCGILIQDGFFHFSGGPIVGGGPEIKEGPTLGDRVRV